ncbi:hypothetical protein EDC01DRAFT_673656 [Geopyxis carbonaria]|nr:hypothetical protein EDC01DRAFT_673656 [Geopyxis carbonaria]
MTRIPYARYLSSQSASAPSTPPSPQLLKLLFPPPLPNRKPFPYLRKTSFTPLASYSWLDDSTPTILYPGSPAVFAQSLPPATTLPPDRGSFYVDQNAARLPEAPLTPLLVAVSMIPDAEAIPTPHIITDRINLLRLLRFVQGNTRRGDSFRISVQRVGLTLLLQSHEKMAVVRETLGWGFEHSYEKAVTVPSTVGHYRVVAYGLSGMRLWVRHKVDAALGDRKEKQEPLVVPPGEGEEIDRLRVLRTTGGLQDGPPMQIETKLGSWTDADFRLERMVEKAEEMVRRWEDIKMAEQAVIQALLIIRKLKELGHEIRELKVGIETVLNKNDRDDSMGLLETRESTTEMIELFEAELSRARGIVIKAKTALETKEVGYGLKIYYKQFPADPNLDRTAKAIPKKIKSEPKQYSGNPSEAQKLLEDMWREVDQDTQERSMQSSEKHLEEYRTVSEDDFELQTNVVDVPQPSLNSLPKVMLQEISDIIKSKVTPLNPPPGFNISTKSKTPPRKPHRSPSRRAYLNYKHSTYHRACARQEAHTHLSNLISHLSRRQKSERSFSRYAPSLFFSGASHLLLANHTYDGYFERSAEVENVRREQQAWEGAFETQRGLAALVEMLEAIGELTVAGGGRVDVVVDNAEMRVWKVDGGADVLLGGVMRTWLEERAAPTRDEAFTKLLAMKGR